MDAGARKHRDNQLIALSAQIPERDNTRQSVRTQAKPEFAEPPGIESAPRRSAAWPTKQRVMILHLLSPSICYCCRPCRLFVRSLGAGGDKPGICQSNPACLLAGVSRSALPIGCLLAGLTTALSLDREADRPAGRTSTTQQAGDSCTDVRTRGLQNYNAALRLYGIVMCSRRWTRPGTALAERAAGVVVCLPALA